MATALGSLDALDTGVVMRRFAQFALDTLFSSLVVFLQTMLHGFGAGTASGSTAWLVLVGITGSLLTLYWYWVLRPARTGQTWGIRLMGIRIITADHSPLTERHASLRVLLLLLDGLAGGLVGLGVMLASPRRQRLGDAVAGTLVVRD